MKMIQQLDPYHKRMMMQSIIYQTIIVLAIATGIVNENVNIPP
jgi:hypothetical protein